MQGYTGNTTLGNPGLPCIRGRFSGTLPVAEKKVERAPIITLSDHK